MTNDEHIDELTHAFEEAVKAAALDLAGEYKKRLAVEFQPTQPGRDYAVALREGVGAISGASTQSDILEALLDAAAKVAPACGLLVLRGTIASGWNCRGLTSTAIFKRAILDCSRGIAAHVITTCSATEAPVSELDPALVTRLNLYGKSRVALVPVLLRDRPAAMLLALLPMGDELPALEVLAQTARLTLELQYYRATSGEAAEHETAAKEAQAPAAPVEPPAHGHVEEYAAEAASVVEVPAAENKVSEAPVSDAHVSETMVETAAMEESAPEPQASVSVYPNFSVHAAKVEEIEVTETPEPEPQEITVEAPAEPAAYAPEPVAEPAPEEFPVTEIPIEPLPESPVPEPYVHPAVAAAEEWRRPVPVTPPAYVPPAHVAQAYVPPAVYGAPAAHVPPAAEPPSYPGASAPHMPAPAAHTPAAPMHPGAAYGYPSGYPGSGFSATPPAPAAPYGSAHGSTYGAPQYPPAAPAPSPAGQPFGTPPVDLAHEKARRFAKLLVEEIKLYNQSKVSEGRARGDLYARLREDIEKSRAAYTKRYGQGVCDVDYFSQELLRILADNRRELMGAGFPG
ncbi:MAG: hypothetical protein P4M01_11540 [Acidobacteriota bacterium]|nr:hypothetical protein [Acidobacteriota bacterium]